MRALRAVFWLGLAAVALAAVIVPGVWVYAGATLTNPIEGEQDLETYLRQSIESERLGLQMAVPPRDRRPVKWARPQIVDYPKRLVALFITETGCPTYFQTPREDGAPWLKRLALKAFNGQDMDGDGGCELIFARMLARRLGATSTLQQAAAADRIHRFLQRDQLVAYTLASLRLEPGVIGVAEASRELMQKELAALNDAELAELQLAIPPWDYWDDIRACQSPALIREARDTLLNRLAQQGLISEEMAKTAQAQPVRCLSVKR